MIIIIIDNKETFWEILHSESLFLVSVQLDDYIRKRMRFKKKHTHET